MAQPRMPRRRALLLLLPTLALPGVLGAAGCKERRSDPLRIALSGSGEAEAALRAIAANYARDRGRPVHVEPRSVPEVKGALERGEVDVGLVEVDAAEELVAAGAGRSRGTMRLDETKFGVLVPDVALHDHLDAKGGAELAAFAIAATRR